MKSFKYIPYDKVRENPSWVTTQPLWDICYYKA